MYTNGNWHSEMQGVSAAIDDTFGEQVTVTPCCRRPNFQPAPQPEHAIALLAVFSWRAKMIFKLNSGTNAGQEGLAESREPIFSFSRAALPWAFALGDQITRDCDGAMFEIKTVAPDGVSRIVAACVQLGLQTQ